MTLLLLALAALPIQIPEFCPMERVVGEPDSALGRAVVLQGDVFAVGEPSEGAVGGRVRIYDVSGDRPLLTQTLEGSAPGFGTSLALHAGRLAVGAPFDDESTGRVYIYEQQPDSWLQSATIEPPLADMFEFGRFVTLTEDFICVRSQQGPLRIVFAYAAADLSAPVFSTDSTGLSFTSGGFARTLAASGSDLVIGYPFGVRIVDLTDLTTQELPMGSLDFGRSVAIDGDRIAIGDSSYPLGRVHTYVRSDGVFVPEQILSAIAPIDLGWFVALDGPQLLTAGLFENSVQIFQLGAEGWQFRKSMTMPFVPASSLPSGLALDGPRFAAGVFNEFEPSAYLRLAGSPCFSVPGGDDDSFFPWEQDFGLWSVQPSVLPAVMPTGESSVTVFGINLADIFEVRLNDELLSSSAVVNNNVVDVDVPLLPELGRATLTLTNLWGIQRSIDLRVVSAEPPALTLDAPAAETAHTEQPVVTLGGEPGRLVFLFGSFAHAPTDFPGVAALDIGASGTALISLGTHTVGAAGWVQVALHPPAFSGAATLHLQGVAFDPLTGTLPASSTNLATLVF